jgi:hypothetical protein
LIVVEVPGTESGERGVTRHRGRVRRGDHLRIVVELLVHVAEREVDPVERAALAGRER